MVGGNQQSTVFSGVISDGESPDLPPQFITGQPSYVGGSFTKVGICSNPTGTNSYIGGTIIEGERCNSAMVERAGALLDWTVPPGAATVSGGTVQTFGDFNLGGGEFCLLLPATS